jgi:SPP1 gp7 family putative phage head morphogenesis protein
MNHRRINWRTPDAIGKQYQVILTRQLNVWKKKAKEIIFPLIEGLIIDADFYRSDSYIRVDDWITDLSLLMDRYGISIDDPDQDARLLNDIEITGNAVDNFNNNQWLRVTKQLIGVPLLQLEPWRESQIQGFVSENISLITNLKQSVLDQIETTINRGIKQGKRSSTIKNELLNGTSLQKGVFKKLRTRAQLIARDQVDKLNGQLSKLRQSEAGIKQYTWLTARDERVRAKHRKLDGKICKWSNPTVYKNNITDKKWLHRSNINAYIGDPGQDYQCRCVAIPIIPEELLQ